MTLPECCRSFSIAQLKAAFCISRMPANAVGRNTRNGPWTAVALPVFLSRRQQSVRLHWEICPVGLRAARFIRCFPRSNTRSSRARHLGLGGKRLLIILRASIPQNENTNLRFHPLDDHVPERARRTEMGTDNDRAASRS